MDTDKLDKIISCVIKKYEEIRKNYEENTIYIIKCEDETEDLFNIGRTKIDIYKKLNNMRTSDPGAKLIYNKICTDAESCLIKIQQRLLDNKEGHSSYRYDDEEELKEIIDEMVLKTNKIVKKEKRHISETILEHVKLMINNDWEEPIKKSNEIRIYSRKNEYGKLYFYDPDKPKKVTNTCGIDYDLSKADKHIREQMETELNIAGKYIKDMDGFNEHYLVKTNNECDKVTWSDIKKRLKYWLGKGSVNDVNEELRLYFHINVFNGKFITRGKFTEWYGWKII